MNLIRFVGLRPTCSFGVSSSNSIPTVFILKRYCTWIDGQWVLVQILYFSGPAFLSGPIWLRVLAKNMQVVSYRQLPLPVLRLANPAFPVERAKIENDIISFPC